MIQLIRGFKDILPGETEIWQHIEKTAITLFEDFGFKEIRVPVLEHTELFARSIGEDTDIVEKEMYTFADRNGELITLRPEATASVVRSYIQQKLYSNDPVQKLYTIGPMFRRERPQKGRFRQFYQINAEVFGIASPLIDAQMIFMLMLFFNRLSVPDISVHINSLGCMKCRPDYKSALSVFLENKKDFLCEDCKKRSDKNPLRVLDCKVPDCREVLKDAPDIANYLCKDCKDHFETVILWLNGLNVPYAIDKRLVRGLDYYTRTTFEIQTGSLGAQSAVAGGGRYDCLVKSLGGPDQPAIGFAIGFDRLVSIFLIDNKKDFTRRPGLFIAALGEKGRAMAFDWLCTFFKNGICSEMDYEDRSLKSQMNRANKLGARYVLILGENEISTGSCILRNMNTKEQKEILLSEVVQEVGRLKAED